MARTWWRADVAYVGEIIRFADGTTVRVIAVADENGRFDPPVQLKAGTYWHGGYPPMERVKPSGPLVLEPVTVTRLYNASFIAEEILE